VKLILTSLCVVLSALLSDPSAPGERAHCNLAALTAADKARGHQLVPVLAEALKERKDLPDGYAYRFEPRVMKEVGEWIQIVAKCCQPLSYEVSLEPQPGGALWVRITGYESKEFIGLEFAPLGQKLPAKDARR
jgi:hypothetical protein